MRLLPRLTRQNPTNEENTVPKTDDHDVLMRFLTQGGAVVELYPHTWTEHLAARSVKHGGFQWECRGCGAFGGPGTFDYEKAAKGYSEREPNKSRDDANAHADTCRSMPRR